MIDQIEVERFKLQILGQIQDEELTNGTAVIEIPAGTEEIAQKALFELKEVLERRNVKTVVVSDAIPEPEDELPSMPLNPNEAVCILTIAFTLLSDQHAALMGNVQAETIRHAFTQLALGLHRKMSKAEMENFLKENFPG